MSEEPESETKPGRIWRRWLIFGVPLLGAGAAFVAGVVFWGGFNTAMEATNTMSFCISCHEMRDNVYKEYRHTIHYQNRSGVQATCSDCHVPDPWVHKVVRKVKASKELYGKVVGTINTPEKFEANRLRLARNVWHAMKNTDSRECRNCHTIESMAPEFQRPRARQQHLTAMETGQTCIDCHKGIAHKGIRDLVPEDELEALETPDPRHIKVVPDTFLASLAYIEKVEAEAVEKAAAEKAAAEAAISERIAAAVAAATVEASPGAGVASSGESITPGIDWAAVPGVPVTLFYPGQASFEWIQNGKEHGGARAFTKGGDRCATCHGKEVANMGAKIVSGEKLEPTPIPGKRGSIDATVQAAHDGETLFLRLQWADGGHAPVPFVEGGRMDPDHPVKVAMMIVGQGIEFGEQSGCWSSCHADSRYMPDAPDAAALAADPALAGRLNLSDGVTKYIPESRSEIELRGRGGAPLGGWDKVKDAADIEAYLAGGTYLDLLRVYSDGTASTGHVLEARLTEPDAAGVRGSARLEGGTWTVEMARPLSGGPGDVALEAGRTYTVGFAIHDDHSVARFHHVSLEFRLALDNPEAEINAVGQ